MQVNLRYIEKGGFCKSRDHANRHVKQLPYVSIVQATEGSYAYGANFSPMKDLGEGGIFLATASDRQEIQHNVDPHTHCMSARWVFLDLYVDDQRFDLYHSLPPIPDPETTARLNALLDELFGMEDICDCYSVCYQIVKVLLSVAGEVRIIRRHTANAVSYITKHYTEELTVESIAKHCCVSPQRLYAVFKEDLNATIIQYLTNVRLSHSCYLLQNTDHSISEISKQSGFMSTSYFSKVFKKHYGVSPMKMRDRTAGSQVNQGKH